MKNENQPQIPKTKPIKSRRMNKEKRFYLFTAIVSAVALIAIVTVSVVMSRGADKKPDHSNNQGGVQDSTTVPPVTGDNDNDDEQVVVTPEGMVMPIASATLLNDYGFYHNDTLNCYYQHQGIDFSAEVGMQVVAVEAGVIESIYSGDLLSGTEIVVDHGDGIKSVYRFVEEISGLKTGDSVGKGEVIATVAEANGNEYKDGAHLHFEITKEGKTVDPTTYLTLEEK